MNFSRLRLGIGFAMLLGIATATASFAQSTGSSAPGAASSPIAAPTAAATAPAAAATAPVAPSTPVAAPTATPVAAPTATPPPGPRRGRRAPGPASSSSAGAQPSETPEPPQFSTLDGIWEVEQQPIGKPLAVYSHFDIISTGANLTGYWESGGPKNVKYPMTGTFDGRLISLTAALPNGASTTFSGYVESFADMVGMMHVNDKDPGTAFTAQHRKKQKG